MTPCTKNPFCGALPPELREQLCTHCTKTTFADQTEVHIDRKHVWIVIDGLFCSLLETDQPNSLIVPGTVILNPWFSQFVLTDLKIDIEAYEEASYRVNYKCLSNMTIAMFTNEYIFEMLDNNIFLKQLFFNIMATDATATTYANYLYQHSAKESIEYVLRLAKTHSLGPLTHRQIAFLTNRNRVTVTRVMHEIALENPDLVNEQSI